MIPLNRMKRNGKVDLWDLGPQVPDAPKPPPEPDKTKLKGADLASAELDYEAACERYKSNLRAYGDAKRAHLDWHRDMGGPVKVELWGVDARHAMDIEPDRYKLDLPRGQKPGRAQLEADERSAVEIEELKRARALDPQFGAGALQ